VPGNKKGPLPNAPSLDRIDSARGYVPGNVQVVSHKANTMKSNASTEELIAFSEWVQKEVVGTWRG
jgi:UDP-N-acetylenolpyruvoylglucosamine reductase